MLTRKKYYKKLRGLLAEHGDKQTKLPVILDMSQSYCDERMSGSKEWKLSDCYKILDYYNVPHERLHEYFPKGGISDDQLCA